MTKTTQALIIIALVLAISAGTVTVAEAIPVKNNNPGDLKWDGKTQWLGQVGVDAKNFIIFDTVEHGERAAAITAIHYFTNDGVETLTEFGNRWAPASDNGGVATYGASLASYIGVNADDPYDYQTGLAVLLQAIFHNEDNLNPVDYDSAKAQQIASATLTELGIA